MVGSSWWWWWWCGGGGGGCSRITRIGGGGVQYSHERKESKKLALDTSRTH